MVEFAAAAMAMCLTFLGVFQFGYAFYVYNALAASVTGAAQYGARLDYDTSNSSAYTTAVRNMVLYGDTAAGARPIVGNLAPGHVSIGVNPDAQGMPSNVTVAISGYTINALFRQYTLTNKPRVTAKYIGRPICSGC